MLPGRPSGWNGNEVRCEHERERRGANMLEPAVIKKEIQVRYDDLGERTRTKIEGFQEPARLWPL